MATLTSPPSLVLPTTSYLDYVSCSETNTFRRRYAAVPEPYTINHAHVTADVSSKVAQLIYSEAQEGIPTVFLQWHQGARVGARADCAPPFSVKQCPEDIYTNFTMGQWIL